MQLVFGKIAGFSHHEAKVALKLRIKLGPVQGSKTIGMVWIKQQSVKHGAQYTPVASVLFQRFSNSIFQLAIRTHHRSIHRYADITFLVRRKFSRNVFEEHESAQLHEEFTEEQGRCSWLAADHAGGLRFRASILGGFHF